MKPTVLINLYLIYFFQSTFILINGTNINPDPVPLVTIIYAQRNLTIYTSSSNPSREPKQWLFWYDPLIVFDSSKDIYQYNEQVRFQFSISSKEFDQIARKTIISKMHPDVEQFALFWIIEPLPIHTLTIYVIDQILLAPIAGIYPCTKTQLAGLVTFECQFQCSSMFIASSMTEKLLCGKYKFQLEYYIQPLSVPPRLASLYNLQNLRSSFSMNKYLHKKQENNFIEKYFIQIQSIDNTIKEKDLQKLFQLATNTTTRYEVNNFNDIWSFDDLETIINHDLFYITYHTNNKALFHLKNSDSPWALESVGKQTLSIEEIQTMFFEQDQLNVQWSFNEKRWKIQSVIVHSLTDILDHLQLILINKQYNIDLVNSTHHRSIDCSDWSTACLCQSTSSAVVFLSNTQFIRISNIDIDFSLTGFTIELWIRPHLLPAGKNSIQIINFHGQYQITYQPKGEIRFSVIDLLQNPNLYTTTIQTVPLNEWTHVSCIYSPIDNQLQLYVNGEFTSSIVLSTKPKKITNDIIIGQEFIGAVRNLRLWSCVRNPDEIRFTMNIKTLFGNETCLVGLWPMTETLGQNILDLSLNGIPHPGTLGFDDNPNLLNDPIWAYVLPTPPPPPPPKILTYRIFRENISLPMVARWGSIVDQAIATDFDGDGLADFIVYRKTTMTWLIASSNDPNIILTKQWGWPGDLAVGVNFDGDKFADYAVFRPSTGEWIAHLSSNPSFIYFHKWGKPGDTPCPGDFDGDGKTDFVVYRKGAYYINPSRDPSTQWTKQWGQPGDVCVPNCDFDGDGTTDFTVWTPKTGIWSWIASGSPWLIYQKQWGHRYDRPLCGDYDGDKKKDFVAYRNWTGEWFIMPFRLASVIITYQWGRPTDFPVGGDFDGDGKADFALWRPRRNRTYVWEIIPSQMPVAMLRKTWGIANDIPVIGDFDGDKLSDFTVWRPTNGFWYVLFIDRPGIQQIKHWGFTVNDTAVAGDWDGDLITDYTIYRPSTGYWYIMLSRNPILQIFMQWGVPIYNDVAVPGDFDGDGKYDFAVWRPSTGMWFILPSTNPAHIVMAQWGIEGDIPVTGVDYDGDGKTDLAVWRPSTGSWYILPSSNPVYPYFGPFLIKQPLIPLPPPGSAASASAPGAPIVAAPGAAAPRTAAPVPPVTDVPAATGPETGSGSAAA